MFLSRAWTSTKPLARIPQVLLLAFLAAPVLAVAAVDEAPWPRSTPEEQGVDSRALASFLERVQAQDRDLRSLIVLRHGHLILECYVHPYDAGTLHNVKSVSKSVLGALAGIGLEEGDLPELNTPVAELLPELSPERHPKLRDDATDPRKRQITLRHLLTMTSGLDLDENGPITEEIFSSQDWVAATWERPVVAEPGSVFVYSTALTHTFSAVLTRQTGQTASEYAAAHLFGPLGVTDYQWVSGPQGHSFGGAELFMRPRDMARFGMLYLSGGRWMGRQIVPAEWVAASTRNQIGTIPAEARYGYGWWLDRDQHPVATGAGGQMVGVSPAENLVVVMTAADPELPEMFGRSMASYPLSEKPLKPRPRQQELLQRFVDQLADPDPLETQMPPGLAMEISGLAYALDPNPLGIERIALRFANAPADTAEVEFVGFYGRERFPVGLDGRYRVSAVGGGGAVGAVGAVGEVGEAAGAAEAGVMPTGNRVALRGHWISGRTFQLNYMEMGDPSVTQTHLTFQRDGLLMRVKIRPAGITHELRGRPVD